jgi:hypothetical protein
MKREEFTVLRLASGVGVKWPIGFLVEKGSEFVAQRALSGSFDYASAALRLRSG